MTTYARLDDDFPENNKIVRLSDGAFRLHVTALCYCSRNLTDGRIPRAILSRLGGSPSRLKELLKPGLDGKPGLWEEPKDFDGWLIHDYLKHQRSRDQVLKEREKARQRWRKATGKEPPNSAEPSGEAEGEVPQNRVVSEVRGQRSEGIYEQQQPRTRENDPRLTVIFTAYENVCGLATAKVSGEMLDMLDSGVPPEWFERAADEAATYNRRNWAYMRTCLDRWRRDGLPGNGARPQTTDPARAAHDAEVARARAARPRTEAG